MKKLMLMLVLVLALAVSANAAIVTDVLFEDFENFTGTAIDGENGWTGPGSVSQWSWGHA